MQKGTPKTYLSSSRTKTALSISPLHFDADLKYEQEYLSKLKTQRLKTQKLYSEYKKTLRERDKAKDELRELQRLYDELKRREDALSGEGTIELLKMKSKCEQLQRENTRLRGQQQEFSNNKWVYEKQVQQLEHEIKLALQEDEYRRARAEELEDENRELEGMVLRYQKEIGQLDEEVASNENKCKQLQKQLTALKDEHSKIKLAWETEKEQLKQTIHSKTDETRTLRHQLQEHCQHKEHEFMVKVQEMQLTMSIQLEDRLKELASTRRTLDGLRDENKRLKAERDTWRERDDLQSNNSIKASLDQLTLRLSSKETEYCDIQKKYIDSLEQIKQLEARIRHLETELAKSEDSCRRKEQNCEEYLKIIGKMELVEERRKVMVESEYDELVRMERIFRSPS